MRLRFVHVNAVDLDGDGVDEIQAGRNIFANLTAGGSLSDQPIHTLPDEFFDDGNEIRSVYLTTNNTAIVTGDVTGDGRENLLVYHQWKPDVRVWGESSVDQVGFEQLSRVEVLSQGSTENVRPILVPVNLDTDGPVLKYVEGEYELVWTEPMIVAALAAAPCAEGIGQNTGACATTFGNSESVGESSEVTVSVNASAYVGVKTAVNVPWVGDVGSPRSPTIATSTPSNRTPIQRWWAARSSSCCLGNRSCSRWSEGSSTRTS